MTSAFIGIICTTSSMIRYEARNRNLNRATATAANRDTAEESSTAETVTSMLLRKKIQNDRPAPAAPPLSTALKFPRVGCAGSGGGVSEKISRAGFNAVETIHRIGNSVRSTSSTPAPFSAILRALRRLLAPRARLAAGSVQA